MYLPPPTLPANIISESLKQGMIPLSIFALCSALSTFALLSWITWRMIYRQDYQNFEGYNQYVILIYNLLLADLQQSLAFLITLHWLNIGKIESPSVTCFTQAWLLNLGDVSSGLFVLAIALHTWYSVVLSRKLNYHFFTASILGIWIFALLLTALGPATKGPQFFAKTNAWCWIDAKYDLYRLWFHYLWVFVVEFGTLIVYAHIFIHLRKRLRSLRSITGHDPAGPRRSARLSQAARYMVLYPLIYVILTLPLAAGRMASMAGKKLPIAYYCMAGSFLTSCGWLDTLLYTLTRRVFVKTETGPGRDTRPPTAGTTKTNQSGRRWLTGKDSLDNHPIPHMDDNDWHLSTFASVTVDFKDLSGTDAIGGASDRSSSEAAQNSNEKGDTTYTGAHTPLGGPRAQTPLGRSATPAQDAPMMSRTETTIRCASPTPDVATRVPRSFGILSETKIEVVSVLRDDLIGGNVQGGLSERSNKQEKADKSEKSEKSRKS